jgi:hypothetical protein
MDRSQNYRRIGNKFYICLYTIIGLASPVFAEAPSNTNIAGPSASATGNVTNQAVQVLQGPFAVNTYGGGVSCQGSTLNLQTFGYHNLNFNKDPETYQTGSFNGGVSLGFSIPLDGSLQELCKTRVRTEISRQQAEADKARLDFELVRLLKCGEAKKSGIDFHPNSPYAKICADIIVQPPKIVTIDPVNSINTKLPQQSNGKVSKQR